MEPPQPDPVGRHAGRLQTPSLTQTSTYALAVHELQGMKADFGLIRFDNKPIGMIVAHGKPVFGAPGSQTIYRGPV